VWPRNPGRWYLQDQALVRWSCASVHMTIVHSHTGDVGIGLNVRRMRTQFLSQFITTYSIRPIGEIGTIYRRYPAQWKVFLQDDSMPGRYSLIAERPERPAGAHKTVLGFVS
jgi:Domain of unknown function (DUF1995)